MERMYPVSRRALVYGLAGVTVLGIPLFRMMIYLPYTNRQMYPDKTVLITGGTGNLAASMTYQLSLRKARVILGCRDLKKCKSLRREIVVRTGHRGIACRYLDLEDANSITEFVKDISEKEPHIDVLINNAAVKHVENRELTKYGIEKNYFVNFLAPFLLTFTLYDKLKETAAITKDVRIINIIGKPKKSWELDLYDINFDERKYNPKAAYRQSKLALAYFTILLEKFNTSMKNNIYTYGINVGSDIILTANDKVRPWTLLRYWRSIGPDTAISSVLLCTLESSLAHRNSSGLLYSYMRTSWGWGVADKRMDDAKCVWNAAKQTLLNLQEVKVDAKVDDKVDAKVDAKVETETKAETKAEVKGDK